MIFTMVIEKRESFIEVVINSLLNDNPAQAKFDKYSILVSLGFSSLLSVILLCIFTLLRTKFKYVYTPRLTSLTSTYDRCIPPMKKSLWGWIEPLWSIKVEDCLYNMGADAVISLLFSRFCRDVFLILAAICCTILIPINIVATNKTLANSDSQNAYAKLSIQNVTGNWTWAHVVICYVFNVLVLFLLARYYQIVMRIRQRYYRSPTYQQSMSSRSLLIMDIPTTMRSNNGLSILASRLKSSETPMHVHICHAIKNLPKILKKHDNAVRSLEAVLAKFFKNPKKLPDDRPVRRVKQGLLASEKVDAIDYYSAKIENYGLRVDAARESLYENEYEHYGFITYKSSYIAHDTARHNSRVAGASVSMAPEPSDFLWDNLSLAWSTRLFNRMIGNMLFIILIIAWIIETALVAIFISNLYHLGSVWPWLQQQLTSRSGFWSIVQGILSPAVAGFTFMILEIIMRRISYWQGSFTKSSRERGVLNKLHIIFTLDNFIIYTLMAVFWRLGVIIAYKTKEEGNFAKGMSAFATFDTVGLSVSSFVQFSTFWIMFIAHSTCSFFVEIAQPITLTIRLIKTKFFSPTPRDLLEWTAPTKYVYSQVLNKLIYFFTIAICYACINPLVLLFASVLFCVNYLTQKYILMYVSNSSTESGGGYWRPVVNRILLGLELANIILFLCLWVQGGRVRAYCIIPNFSFAIAFKIWCMFALDPKSHYMIEDPYMKVVEPLENEISESEMCFGHPSTYAPLLVPMVRSDARALLPLFYSGRTETHNKFDFATDSDDASEKHLRGEEEPLENVDFVDIDNVDTAKEVHDQQQVQQLKKNLSRSYTRSRGVSLRARLNEEELPLTESITQDSQISIPETLESQSTEITPINDSEHYDKYYHIF